VLEPVSTADRVEILDVLRGFAIFGILLVNMEAFGWPLVLVNAQEWPRMVDRVADWLISFFAQGKFYPLFAFLFGYGLTIQMAHLEARGARFIPLYLRRLSVLLLIGAAHTLLLWMGDILITYALVGFPLLLFRTRRPKTLLLWALIGVLITVALYAASVRPVEYLTRRAIGSPRIEQPPGQRGVLDWFDARRTVHIYSRGPYGQIFRQRLAEAALVHVAGFIFLPHLFALFLLGLYAGRRRLLHDIPGHLPFFRKILPWALGIGIAGNLVAVVAEEYTRYVEMPRIEFLGVLSNLVGGPALTFCYVSAFVLVASGEARRLLRPLAEVGRMALSNYLLQSLICTTIFYSYGLGLYGQVGPARGLAIAIAIFLAQIPLSVWWLRRFRFGPAEWLWRSLTYGRLQPMRIAASGATGAG